MHWLQSPPPPPPLPLSYPCSLRNISNPTMGTGIDFKSAQFDQVRGEAEDWIEMRGLEI
jgi:hypothetical protein